MHLACLWAIERCLADHRAGIASSSATRQPRKNTRRVATDNGVEGMEKVILVQMRRDKVSVIERWRTDNDCQI